MGTQNLWVHKMCDDTKFQVSGKEYQNICVLCISCEQKNICAFSIYAFCHMCKNIPCELGFTMLHKLKIKCTFCLIKANDSELITCNKTIDFRDGWLVSVTGINGFKLYKANRVFFF